MADTLQDHRPPIQAVQPQIPDTLPDGLVEQLKHACTDIVEEQRKVAATHSCLDSDLIRDCA